jgi:ATP-dependent exoDNAse (exonuclease V) beta subunit
MTMEDEKFILSQGKKYARISAVIQKKDEFSHIDPEVLKRKAALGTRIHDSISQDIAGLFPFHKLQENGYFLSYKVWVDQLQPLFIQSETRYFCHNQMITGCIDAIAKFQNEERSIIIDWKTSASPSLAKWRLQGHLYYYLVSQTIPDLAPRFLFVMLDKSGNLPQVFQFKFEQKILDEGLKLAQKFWDDQMFLSC